MTDKNKKTSGKTGSLADGRLAILRGTSADGRPTLETYDFVKRTVTIVKYQESEQTDDTICTPKKCLINESEEWAQWNPHAKLAEKYDIERIGYDGNTLLVILTEAQEQATHQIFLRFDRGVIAYRTTNELFRFDLICNLETEHSTKFYGKWTFFTVKNSLYLQQLATETSTLQNKIVEIFHFACIGTNSIVDIAVSYKPIVEFRTL